MVGSGASQGSQDPRTGSQVLCEELKLLFVGSSSVVQEESWYKVRASRKGKEKTNHACLACVHLHACAYASRSVGVINSWFLGAFGKQSVRLQNTPSSLCKHNYINLKRGKRRDLKHCKRLY